MLQLFNSQYPYTDFHELNLDWLVQKVKVLDINLQRFVALNTIKYHDPITWDITTQYEVNTIVIDGNTAYLSKQPVPAGIDIHNGDYWLAVADFTDVITTMSDLRQQITVNEEDSYTASKHYDVNDWVFIQDSGHYLLYYVTSEININGGMVPDYNIKKATVESLIKMYIDNLKNYIDTLTGDLNDLTTSDKTSVVNSINSLKLASDTADTNINNKIGDLTNLTTADKTSVVNSINSLKSASDTADTNINNKIGNLTNLTTADKTSVVNSINSLKSASDSADTALSNRITALEAADVIYYNVKNYGAVGDGVTDDTSAIQQAVAKANTTGGIVFFPRGAYKLTSTMVFTRYGTGVMGENAQATYILHYSNATCMRFGDGINTKQSVSVQHIGIINYGVPSATQYGVHFNNIANGIMFDVIISDFMRGVMLNHAGNTALYSVGVVSTIHASVGIYITNQSVSTVIENCYVGFMGNAVDDSYGASVTGGDIADISFRYFDVGNGIVGIYINGTDSPSDTPPADIRIYDVVVDSARYAGIQIEGINNRGNVLIEGGWINPLPNNAASACIRLNQAANVTVSNLSMQQLSADDPAINGIIAVTSGRLTVNGCRFSNLITDITLEAASSGAIITNNFFGHYGTAAKAYNIASDASNGVVCSNNISWGSSVGFITKTSSDYWLITNDIYLNKTGTAISGTATHDVIANNIS